MYNQRMKLVPIALACFVLTNAACAADGEVKVKASSDEDTKASATFSDSASASGNSPKAVTAERPSDDNSSPAPSQPAAPAAAACPLVCNVAQKGRVTPADEQRLTGELAEVMSSLRSCGQGTATPSLTMRFDSTATLTGFGVDAERGNEGACVDSIRQRHPSVTFQGPATLRCFEHCAGDMTTRSRRRR